MSVYVHCTSILADARFLFTGLRADFSAVWTVVAGRTEAEISVEHRRTGTVVHTGIGVTVIYSCLTIAP